MWGVKMIELTKATSDFLRNHRLSILATTRNDGSPQQSAVAYHFDGKNIVINAWAQSAKALNLGRRPNASLAVTDEARVVVVYGSARIVTGEAAETITHQRLPAMGRAAARRARSNQRVVIVIDPTRVLSNQIDD